MKIFVTGATGVVGRRVVPQLVQQGHSVTAVARGPQKAQQLRDAGAQPAAVDLFDRNAVARAVRGHHAIINLATHIPYPMWRIFLRGAWRENDRLRRDASRILAESAIAARVGRFIQESFAPVYPDRGDAWIDEDTPIAPVRYNRTVSDAERSAALVTERGGTGVVLRFGGFYGPDASQVADMVRVVRMGWSPLPGDPDAWISSVSHDDAASAVIAALQAPAGTYNVVDDRPLRRREWVDSLADAMGAPKPRFAPAWTARLMGSLGEMLVRSERISNRRLRQATGWAPRFPSVIEGWPSTLAALTARR